MTPMTSGRRVAFAGHLAALAAAAQFANLPIAATGSPEGDTLIDLRQARKAIEAMTPRFTRSSVPFHPASGGTIKTHDRHYELARAILRDGAGKTRKARRRLKRALRRAAAHPLS